MNKIFVKNIVQEIKHSLGRFFSILCIVCIGVAFFAGIKASAPDMKYSADQYFDYYDVQDIQVFSTLGLTDKDIQKIKEMKNVDRVMPSFSIDTLTKKDSTQLVMKVISLPKEQKLNKVRLVSGRMPEQENECIIEAGSVSNQLWGNFEIGDTITLTSGTEEKLNKTLKNTKYKVVGTCFNPNYLSYEKGTSTIGSGKVGSFMYVQDSNIKADYYTEIDVSITGAKALNTYSDEYFDLIEPVVKDIENIADGQIKVRIQENQKIVDDARKELMSSLDEAQAKIDEGSSQVQSGLFEIRANEQKLEQAKAQLDTGWNEYNTNKALLDNLPALESAIHQIEEGEAKLPELQNGLAQIEEGLKKLTTVQAGLQKLYDTAIQYRPQTIQKVEDLKAQLAQDPENEELKRQLDLANAALWANDQVIAGYEQTTDQIASLQVQKEQINQAIPQIQAGIAQKADLISKRDQLYTAKTQLDQAYAKLQSGQAEYDSGLSQLNQAKQKIATAQAEIEANQNKLNSEKEKNLKKLEDAQAEINKLKGEWIVLDRNSHYSYRDYGACADRMDGIAQVFPVFFFLVAALVCMTTMTRMVDEQRNEIGTLKALGYSKMQIASKYLSYALIASIVGSILGCLIGMILFPYVIFTAWNTLYNLEQIYFAWQPMLILTASASVTGVTLLATLYSIYSELIEVPSQLMRPKAAKIGKKILLERIPLIWNRFSFLQKVTARNIFRYKKRFFMTVIGIAGCSALLVAGFGINDSISDIVHQQFEVINHFDATVSVNQEANIEPFLKKENEIQDFMKEDTLPVTCMIDDKEANVSIHIVDDPKEFENFTSLRTPQEHKHLKVKENEAIISQKMATKLGVSKGDTIEVQDADEYKIQIKVGGVYENYIGHNVYVTRNTFNNWYSAVKPTTTYLLKNTDTSKDFENKLGQRLMDHKGTKSVTFYSSLQQNFKDMISSISMVVWVLVFSAAALAFVVLYNLSNVNISERMREIATIKVLGFTTKETSQYVNRESIILTIIGAFVGLGVGVILHHLIMNLAELDDIMFGRTITPLSFVISFLLTIAFSIFINLIMIKKIKAIKMVESLKAVE